VPPRLTAPIAEATRPHGQHADSRLTHARREGTEGTDDAPPLAQATVSTERAQAFTPFSIEIGADWGSLQAAMGGLLAEAKDELESPAAAARTSPPAS
jgi:hypothetical protein